MLEGRLTLPELSYDESEKNGVYIVIVERDQWRIAIIVLNSPGTSDARDYGIS